jgi:DNA invertase Pin-like site-specific DNA recombinase
MIDQLQRALHGSGGNDHSPEPLLRSVRSTKILPRHLERSAIVYVRQSSAFQVLEHAESKARQYALADHAVALGWSPGQVVVIDEDQGKSGKNADNRAGFRHLLEEVTSGRVGLVLGLEMSRLARSSKDWHHLLELCALFGALLGDQDGVYNPTDSNDRLLLGLKGTMSEFELFTMRNRLQRGIWHKAERGEMHVAPPVGYERLPSDEIVQDSDEQARSVIQLIFDKFDELGSARKVLIYLVRNGIRLGMRLNRGPRRGTLEWRKPQFGTVWRILTHPNYAGAYVFGRKEVEPGQKTGKHRRFPKRYSADAWKILLKDRMPAYITWERYEANQRRLRANRSGASSAGVPRGGDAMLAGIAICGSCGRRFRPLYPRAGNPYYFCARDTEFIQERTCHGVSARVIDRLVVRQIHEALKPAGLRLSLRAIDDSRKEIEHRDKHWKQQLERARYEVNRAERQYHAVEPENRLVARTLEQRWESALLELRHIEDEYDRFSRSKPPQVTEQEQSRIAALSLNIPALWEATSTTNADRKEIIRCLVDQVVVCVRHNTEYCDVTIHWKGGYTSQHEVVRPVRSRSQLQDDDRLRARVTELRLRGETATAIALTLVSEGFVTPRQRGDYSADIVRGLLRRYGLVEPQQPEVLLQDEWWLPELARKLKVSCRKLRAWADQQWCHARQTENRNRWVVWADQQEIDRLYLLTTQSKLGNTSYPKELITPKNRKAHPDGVAST